MKFLCYILFYVWLGESLPFSNLLIPNLEFPGVENMCYNEFRKRLCKLIGPKNVKRCLGSLHYTITSDGRFCTGFSCVEMYSYCEPLKMQEFQASSHFFKVLLKPLTLSKAPPPPIMYVLIPKYRDKNCIQV